MSGAEPTGYGGIYRGLCVNNQDPAGMSRITAVVPQIFGNTSTVTDWALPCLPTGVTSIPSPGQGVWIMFEGGDLNYPVYMGQWQTTGSGWPENNGTGPGNLVAETPDTDTVGYNMTDNGTGGINLTENGTGNGITLTTNLGNSGGINATDGSGAGINLVEANSGANNGGINITNEAANWAGGITLTDESTTGIIFNTPNATPTEGGVYFTPGTGYVYGSLIGNPAGWMVTVAASTIHTSTATQLTNTAYDGNAARTFLYGGMAYNGNNSLGRLEVPQTGLYGYIVSNYWNNNNTAEMQSFLYLNSSQYIHGEALLGSFDPNAGTTIVASGLVACSAGDLLGAGAFHNVGSDVTINASTPGGHIFVWLVSQ